MANSRLFFGFSIYAPWPENFPQGRILEEDQRHMTFVFLGEQDAERFLTEVEMLPHPPFLIGKSGKFSHCRFLPTKEPRAVSWEGSWFADSQPVENFHKKLIQAILDRGYQLNRFRDNFLPHVTVARSPFKQDEWLDAFEQLPFYLGDFHLFKSLGHSHYNSLWSVPLLHPFDEFEHTADIAYRIRGENLTELYANALTALCFEYPPMVAFINKVETPKSLEQLIEFLNQHLFEIDCEIGIPFKAVSYSGEIKKVTTFLEWEMIVDV